MDSAPAPSWRHNWVLVVEETGRRGGHSEGGELWKPRQYIPWKGAGEEVDPEFYGESARGGSQSRVERKNGREIVSRELQGRVPRTGRN